MSKKDLIEKYTSLYGKKPFVGWSEEMLQEKIDSFNDEGPVTEKSITMPESELKAFIKEQVEAQTASLRKENQNLKRNLPEGEWQEANKEIAGNKTATFRVYRADGDAEPGIVVGFKYLRKDFNEETRKHDIDVYRLTVLYDGAIEKTVEMPLVEFAKITEREEVEIISMKKKQLVKSHGKIRAAARQDGYIYSNQPHTNHAGAGSEFVDLIEKKDLITVTIKRQNGDTYECDANNLNS